MTRKTPPPAPPGRAPLPADEPPPLPADQPPPLPPSANTPPPYLARSPAQLPARSPAFEALYADGFPQRPGPPAVQTCPFADKAPGSKDAPAKEEELPCCVRGLTVKCGHGSRGFVLKPPTTKTNAAYDQVIQMIGDSNGCDLAVVTFDAGPCNRGRGPSLPSVSLGDYAYNSSVTAKVSAELAPESDVLLLGRFMQLYLAATNETVARTYSGSVNCCEGGQEFGYRVEVFPERSWSGKITVGYEFAHDSEVVKYTKIDAKGVESIGEARVYSVDREGSLKFGGEIEISHGGRKNKVTLPGFERTGPLANRVEEAAFSGTRAFFGKILPRMFAMFSNEFVTITPKWPSLSLGGSRQNYEVKGKYSVNWQGKVTFAAEPLLGLSGTTDLLNWAIMGGAAAFGAPQVGTMLARAKVRAEKGVGSKRFGARGKCSIDFTAEGSVGGQLQWTWVPDAPDTVDGKITGELGISLKGEISAEFRAFVIKYQAGAYIKGETGVGGEIGAEFHGEDPGFRGKLLFKGIIVTGVMQSSFGGAEMKVPEGSKNVKAARVVADKTSNEWKPDGVAHEESDNWKWEIVPPAEWPRSESTVLSAGDAP